MNKYFGMLVIIVCWSVNPFLKKTVMKNHKHINSYYLNFLTNAIMINTIYLYYFCTNQYSYDTVLNFSNKELINSFGSSFVGVISSYTITQLLKQESASELLPQLQPLSIILTVAIGNLYGEKFNCQQIVGLLFLIIGLLIFNLKSF